MSLTHLLSQQSQILRALRVGLVALCATAVYEITKLICVPRLSLVQSNIITIFFAGCVGFCISFIIRQREQAAQQESLRLAAIVQYSDAANIITELDGTVTSWNRGAERIYGYSAVETLGRHISFCYPPEKRKKVHAFLQRLSNGEAIESFDTQRLTKNGTIIDVSLSLSAIKDGTGKVVGVSGIARDVTASRRTDKELRLRSSALEAAASGIVITDRQGTIVWANHAFTTMTGYSKDEILGKNPRLLKSGEQPESYYAELWSAISSGKVWQGELVNRRKDGTTYTEEMTITPVTQGLGTAADTHFIAIKRDITERKKTEEELHRLAAIVEFSEDAIIAKDMDGAITSWNRGAERIYGYTRGEVVGRDLSFLLPPERQAEIQAIMEQVLSGQSIECLDTQRLTKTGSVLDVSLSVSPIRDASGHIAGASAIARDITQRKAAEKQVQFLAYYDALTGLPNRTLLQDRLSKALASARRQKNKVALLFLDLDRFKTINDSLGHSVGDLVLQEVAERLMKWAREQDTIARVGGDEFFIVLTAVKDAADAAVAAERLMDAMTVELVIQGRSLGISCSIGISISPEHGRDGEALIKNADAAMYCAKESGCNSFRFFTAGMNAEAMERLSLEHSLRLALEKRELFLVYQPQMDIA